MYLTDVGSSNGTAINDPSKRITRAPIHPADQVYFGTHRIAAWELLKALPTSAERQATAIEAAASPDLERELSSALGRQSAGADGEKRSDSQPVWLWAIASSAVVCDAHSRAPSAFAARVDQ